MKCHRHKDLQFVTKNRHLIAQYYHQSTYFGLNKEIHFLNSDYRGSSLDPTELNLTAVFFFLLHLLSDLLDFLHHQILKALLRHCQQSHNQ